MVELFDRILIVEDADASAAMRPILEAEGVEVITSAQDRCASSGTATTFTLHLEDGRTVSAERLLVATGRAAGVRRPRPGRRRRRAGRRRGCPVLSETLRTTNPACRSPATPRASCCSPTWGRTRRASSPPTCAGSRGPRDYRVVPQVTYTEPEIGSVGLTEPQARDAGHEVVVGRSDFNGSTRAFLEGEPAGFVEGGRRRDRRANPRRPHGRRARRRAHPPGRGLMMATRAPARAGGAQPSTPTPRGPRPSAAPGPSSATDDLGRTSPGSGRRRPVEAAGEIQARSLAR